jgi:hypothetical protein
MWPFKTKRHEGNPYEIILEYDIEKRLLNTGEVITIIRRYWGNGCWHYMADPIITDCGKTGENKK